MTNAHRFLGKCQPKFGGCGQGLAITSDSSDEVKWVTCPECSKRAMLKRVQGEYNPGHKCDPRCTGATGFECSCACGGANHGADHDMKEVVVAASRAPVDASDFAIKPQGKHIGEIGKYICGFVTIDNIRPIGDSKTLVKMTTDGGDKIDWFVPNQYMPAGWVPGDHFKVRAKVVRHEDHERFGKSTVVIFAEKKED